LRGASAASLSPRSIRRGEVDILRRYVGQHEGKTEAPYPAVLARLEQAKALLAAKPR
jgi:hypothetical protein